MVSVPFVEGETRTITVSAPGGFSQQFTFLRDCEQPSALVSHVCAASGIDVSVKNIGNGSGTFSINGTAQLLAPGQSFTKNVAVAEGATVQVTVLVDGAQVPGSPFTLLRDCEQPAALVSHTCAASGLDVTVKNTGTDSGTFSINGTAQLLAPGQSFTKNVAVAEGATVQVTVLLDGNAVAGSPFTFLRDCAQPEASVTHECADSGLDVTVTNTGDESGAFSMDGTSQSLAPGQHFTKNVAVAEGATVQVTVLMNGAPVPGSPFSFLRDCEQPGASATNNCTDNGTDLALSNSGESPATLTVTKNGAPIDTVTVPGGGAVFRSYPLAEDEIAIFRVTGPGFDSGALIVTHDCVQVRGTIIVTPGPPLAVTGRYTEPLAITGGLFICTGVLALLGSKRRRRLPLG
jgi:hypothetical protein